MANREQEYYDNLPALEHEEPEGEEIIRHRPKTNPFGKYRSRDRQTENPFLRFRPPYNPVREELRRSQILTAMTPEGELEKLPLPEFPPEHVYLNSEAFRSILQRYKTQGEEVLTDDEKRQLKDASDEVPTVKSFVLAVNKLQEDIRDKIDREKKEAERLEQEGPVAWLPNPVDVPAKILEKTAQFLGIKDDIDREFLQWSPQFMAVGEKVTNTLKDLAWWTIKYTVPTDLAPERKDIAWLKEDESMQYLAEAMREHQTVGENAVAGAIQMMPYFAYGWGPVQFLADIAKDPGILPQMAKDIWNAYYNVGQAWMGNKVAQETLKKHPFETGFAMTMPFLIAFGVKMRVAKIRQKAQAKAATGEGAAPGTADAQGNRVILEFNEAEANAREAIKNAKEAAGKAEGGEGVVKALDRLEEIIDAETGDILRTEKGVTTVETPDAVLGRIRGMSTGELMTELIELQGGADALTPHPSVSPTGPQRLVRPGIQDILKMSRSELLNRVSGGRISLEEARKIPEPELRKPEPPKPPEEVEKAKAQARYRKFSNEYSRAQDAVIAARERYDAAVAELDKYTGRKLTPEEVQAKNQARQRVIDLGKRLDKVRSLMLQKEGQFVETKRRLAELGEKPEKIAPGEPKPPKEPPEEPPETRRRTMVEPRPKEEAPEKPTETITQSEIDLIENRIAKLREDIYQKQGILEQMEGVTGKDADILRQHLKIQIGERMASLEALERELGEAKKKKVVPPEEPPEPEPPEPEPTPEPPPPTEPPGGAPGKAEEPPKAETPSEAATAKAETAPSKAAGRLRTDWDQTISDWFNDYYDRYVAEVQALEEKNAPLIQDLRRQYDGAPPRSPERAKIKEEIARLEKEVEDAKAALENEGMERGIAFHEEFKKMAEEAGLKDEALEQALQDFDMALGEERGNFAEFEPGVSIKEIAQRVIEDYTTEPKEPPPTTTAETSTTTRTTQVPEGLKGAEVFYVKRGELNIDPKRFQKRNRPYSMATVRRIVEDYQPLKLAPLIIWKDPKNGKYYILSGHSRYEGTGRIGVEDLPAKEFKGTEAEAMKFARESNFEAEGYNMAENIDIAREMRLEGKTFADIERQIGEKAKDIFAFSHLNPKGLFIQALTDDALRRDAPRVETKAKYIGLLRKEFPQLTNLHEDQIFKAMYLTEGDMQSRYFKMHVSDFRDFIAEQVNKPDFDPSRPLHLGGKILEGLEARADTGETVRRINSLKQKLVELEKDKDRPGIKEAMNDIRKEVAQLENLLAKHADDQLSMLGDLIKPVQKLGGGLGIINPIRPLSEMVAGRLARAERVRAQAKDPAITGKISKTPKFYLERKEKDVGLLGGTFRTMSNIFGVIPDQPARYGEKAQRAARDIILTDAMITIQKGLRVESLEAILENIAKKDYGKEGEKFWDYMENPKRQGELDPKSRDSARLLREFLDADREEAIDWFRERLRKSTKKAVETEYRKAHGLERRRLTEEQKKEIADAVEDRLRMQVPDDWGIENYLPHIFPGNYEVFVLDNKKLTFIGAEKTAAEALARALDHYAENPHLSPDAYSVKPREFRVPPDITRVSRANFWRIAKEISDAAGEAVSKDKVAGFLSGKLGLKEKKQKYAFFLQKREGYEGHSKNLAEALSVYNDAFVRWRYLTSLYERVAPLIEAVNKERRPVSAQLLQNNFDYLWGKPPTRASRMLDNTLQAIPWVRDHVAPMALDRWSALIRMGTLYGFWKAKPSAQIVNRFQRAQTLYPTITTGEWRDGLRLYHSKEGREILDRHGIRFFTGGKFLEGGRSLTSPKFREKMRTLAPETSNQEIAYLTLYEKARKLGYSDPAAHEYAFLRGPLYTQFTYLRSDVPVAFQGPIGSTVFQFKRFSVKNYELAADLIQSKNYPGFAKWMGAQILLGGMRTLTRPAAKIPLVGAGLAWIGKETYDAIKEEAGEEIANVIAFGLPSLVGLDFSYTIQVVDLPTPDSPGAVFDEFMPPLVTTTWRTIQSAKDTKGYEEDWRKRTLTATVQNIPALKWVESLYLVTQGLNEGKYEFRDPAGRLRFRGDIKDVLVHGLSGRTVEEGQIELMTENYLAVADRYDSALDEIAMKMIRQIESGEDTEWETDLLDWNELWPEFPIAPDAIISRVRERYRRKDLDKFERMMMNMPKNIRLKMQQEE